MKDVIALCREDAASDVDRDEIKKRPTRACGIPCRLSRSICSATI